MRKYFVVCFVMAIIGCHHKEAEVITVFGKATIRVPVEYLQIRLTIVTEGSTYTKANEENKELVLKMFDILHAFSIPDSDFVTSSSETAEGPMLSHHASYKKFTSRLQKVEYSGLLFLRRPTFYDTLFKELLKLGKVQAGVVRVGSSVLQEYRSEAYRQAVIKAKLHAEMLMSETNRKLGKILKLIDDSRGWYSYEGETRSFFNLGAEDATTFQHSGKEIPIDSSTFRKKYFEVNAIVAATYEMD